MVLFKFNQNQHLDGSIVTHTITSEELTGGNAGDPTPTPERRERSLSSGSDVAKKTSPRDEVYDMCLLETIAKLAPESDVHKDEATTLQDRWELHLCPYACEFHDIPTMIGHPLL